MNASIVDLINGIVWYATGYLMPILLICFILAVIARILITIIINRQKRFVKGYCKRVHQYIYDNPDSKGTFYRLFKRFLVVTYFESFELRTKYKRRNQDHVMTIEDRVFLIQDGIIRLIDDFLNHARYLRKEDVKQPNFHEITNNAFSSNPVFNRVFGLLPMSRTNDILNILPGIFIVAGIFGTFLGIMKALPELTGMDITNAEASKIVIDSFLINIAFALSTSILGIILSVIMSFLNTLFSPDNTYLDIINSFKSATEILWNKSDTKQSKTVDDIKNDRESEAVDAFEIAIANMYAKTLVADTAR
jgi:hypothetical protein